VLNLLTEFDNFCQYVFLFFEPKSSKIPKKEQKKIKGGRRWHSGGRSPFKSGELNEAK
jgi:hypothetical protein